MTKATHALDECESILADIRIALQRDQSKTAAADGRKLGAAVTKLRRELERRKTSLDQIMAAHNEASGA